jgi:hypothetical protein
LHQNLRRVQNVIEIQRGHHLPHHMHHRHPKRPLIEDPQWNLIASTAKARTNCSCCSTYLGNLLYDFPLTNALPSAWDMPQMLNGPCMISCKEPRLKIIPQHFEPLNVALFAHPCHCCGYTTMLQPFFTLILLHFMICHSKCDIDPAPQDVSKTTRCNNIQDAFALLSQTAQEMLRCQFEFGTSSSLPLEPELAPSGWRCPHRRLTLMRPFGNGNGNGRYG